MVYHKVWYHWASWYSGTAVYHNISYLCMAQNSFAEHPLITSNVTTQFGISLLMVQHSLVHGSTQQQCSTASPRGVGEKSGTWGLISSWLYNATFAPIVSKVGPHLLFSMEFISKYISLFQIQSGFFILKVNCFSPLWSLTSLTGSSDSMVRQHPLNIFA